MQNIISFLALFSAVTAAIVAYTLAIKKEQIFYIRKKYEDLYIALSSYESSILDNYKAACAFLLNDTTYEKVASLAADKPINENSFEDINMIINVYFPDLIRSWLKFNQASKLLVSYLELVENYKYDNTKSQEKHQLLIQISDEKGKFDIEVVMLKHFILDAARQKAIAEALWPRTFILTRDTFLRLLDHVRRNRSRSLDG